jgi:UDP-N-acetylglucosamine 4,6-dehydratase
MLNLNGKNILLTGGTGSFGKQFIKTIYELYPDVGSVTVYSRDELKQFEMGNEFLKDKYPTLHYVIGDVRDRDQLKRACEGINIIVHAAALKHVPIAEFNPIECIRTNILGAENVIEAAYTHNIENVVALSTDKAAAPINLYGATKLCSDKLFIAANHSKKRREIKLSVVRYGNVLGSRGSVIPYFLEKRKTGVLPITDERMTRFNITLDQGVKMIFCALEKSWGGEIFVPKIPSYKILDVAKAVAPYIKCELVGIRPGEKLHEEMITETDSLNTIEFEHYYTIIPSSPMWNTQDFIQNLGGKRVPNGFKYNSDCNTHWVSVEEIREQIKIHIDASFKVM